MLSSTPATVTFWASIPSAVEVSGSDVDAVGACGGARSSISVMRASELMPVCTRMTMPDSIFVTWLSVVTYVANATNVPMLMVPCSANQPPARMLATSAASGSCSITG